MKALRFTCLALALVAPALAAASVTPAVDPKPSSSFGTSIDVRVVNVEAVVTDRRGNRIAGLSAADFRLLVDGKEVPVDYFTEVVEGEMAAPPVEEGAPAAAASSAPGGKVGTSYLVFIDESFSIAAQRDVVLQRFIRDLKRLRAGDRMAVVAFDGRKINLLRGWTEDREALRRILAQAQSRPSQGIARLAMRRTEGAVGDLIQDGGAAFVLYAEVESAAAAAAAAMRGISTPPGRKVFLLLSGGWPLFSGEHLIADPLREIPSAFYTPRPEELFEPVTDTANLLGYTIYAVDVPGLDPESTWSDARSSGATNHGFITSDWERGTHATLEFLAGETGGKAVLNSARLNAFERVEADTRTYYWLGFTPQWRADGKRHDIRVEVRRPGARVRARSGFSDLSREAEAQLQTESLLLFGGEEGERRLRVRAGEPRRAGLWKMELPVILEIPASALTPLPADGGYEVQATLSMGALDRWGERTRLASVPLRLTLPAAPGPGVYARYETVLRLPKGPQRLVFSVEDATGGGRAWAEVDVEP
ncbi:MAG TPA: VWA domain-containing protein [Thermoanaerobaculia bacterium]|jgi:VWFA-related protein